MQARKIADVFSDTDGIADWWRLAYFGHALGQAGDLSRGQDDPDGDGVSNLTEFLNGSNPTNSASFPVLAPFAIAQIFFTNGTLQVNCQSATNWTYQLQSRDSLDSASSWINAGPTAAGNGGIISLIDTATNVVRFYRVQAR